MYMCVFMCVVCQILRRGSKCFPSDRFFCLLLPLVSFDKSVYIRTSIYQFAIICFLFTTPNETYAQSETLFLLLDFNYLLFRSRTMLRCLHPYVKNKFR